MNDINETASLIQEVEDICTKIENPPPDIIQTINKTSEMLLRENVLKTVQDSLSVVSFIDKKIAAIIQIIFDRIQNDDNVKLDDLYRLFNILKSYRLNSFRTVTDPLKSTITSDMNKDDDGSDLNKLANNLSSGDQKKLKNLSSNLAKFNNLLSLLSDESKPEETK
jgi:hypothetical protein